MDAVNIAKELIKRNGFFIAYTRQTYKPGDIISAKKDVQNPEMLELEVVQMNFFVIGNATDEDIQKEVDTLNSMGLTTFGMQHSIHRGKTFAIKIGCD